MKSKDKSRLCIYITPKGRCKNYAIIDKYCTYHWDMIIKKGLNQLIKNKIAE